MTRSHTAFQSAFSAAATTATSSSHNNAMAASGFHSNQPAGLPSAATTSSYTNLSSLNSTSIFDRDRPFVRSNPPKTPASVARIRKLPLGTSEDTLRVMAVFAKDLDEVEVLPLHLSTDEGFCSAILTFSTEEGALEAKEILDGKTNFANSASMIVEVMTGITSRGGTADTSGTTVTPVSSVASSRASNHASNQMRFPLSFTSSHDIATTAYGNGTTLPTTTGATDLSGVEPAVSAQFQNIFSPQSPIGNHLTERTRMSGKALINNDTTSDDDTRELLKNPLAYAESGGNPLAYVDGATVSAAIAAQQYGQTQPMPSRRATGSQLTSISQRMGGLSLNTTVLGGPTTGLGSAGPLSAYAGSNMGSVSAHPATMSPSVMGGPVMPQTGYQHQHQHQHGHYRNHTLPPANPADQNPPCNTLYVGNLPMDTSEEELKALFCKQRGYKRLCFRTKQNGPMCFVEFEDISFATKALNEMYGIMLHNSIKGGIRLSFSKNPLGVRSGQNPNQNGPVAPMGVGMNAMIPNVTANGFGATNGPPPGLTAPPGLGGGRMPYTNSTASLSNGVNGTNGNAPYAVPPQYSATNAPNNSWANASLYQSAVNAGNANGNVASGPSGYPAFMMGR